MLKVKQCKYSLVSATSMGVRITPFNGEPVNISKNYIMQATSAETNVLNVPASLGKRTLALTKFVSDSPIADFIKRELRARNIEYQGKEIPQGGPWGYRHQFNIADSGCGSRGPRVHNDRAGEVGQTLSAEDFDLKQLFEVDGVGVLHISGLICALSPQTSKLCLQLSKYARANGTVVSFDLNYRASFWSGREKELREVFAEIASNADVLVGNEEDFQLCLGQSGPEAGGKDLSNKIDRFKEMIMNTKRSFPHPTVFATTLRQVVNANEHYWGALSLFDDKWTVIQPRSIRVLDRIGGGDGFVGGLLYGIMQGWDAEKCTQFGWATGALATTVLEDYATPVDEKQVWSVYDGDARVKR